ncbi:IS91 family transposase [Herbaspirillum sp. GCM10030257]|uniref:IS91 family transposase n=1 Tax=Herbaspirillum sp. GCM10030257 TaxID=3273393 RepID=UPI0036162ED0
MSRTVQRIVQQHFPAIAEARTLPPHWYRAANKLSRCRTAALGGHVQSCPDGHVERVWYNSCRHRSCPQCNQIQITHWLDRQRARLLQCSHHHIIFTIPHEFNALWRCQTTVMMEILFTCARESLLQMLRDERRLGDAEPGFLLALHTWGRSLSLHPHLHCLITDGGLSEHGWQAPRGSCFLPARALMAKFRGKFIDLVRRALDHGDLALPPQTDPAAVQTCLNKLGRAKWNVHLRERYGHGNGVVQYLARYVRGGPMQDSQIGITNDDHVSFRYMPHADVPGEQKTSVMRMASVAFLRRYLQHVPEPRKHTVRSYGLYAPRKADLLNSAREAFGQPPIPDHEPVSWQSYLQHHVPDCGLHRCPTCGSAMRSTRRIAPQRGPPVAITTMEQTHA